MIRKSLTLKTVVWIFMCLMFFSFLSGCFSDDENIIEICNEDDEEYLVQLHRDDDGSVVREFNLGEWYDFSDVCEKFKDLDEDWYYITIYEDGSATASDTSEKFYLEKDDTRYFWIESPGRLHLNDDAKVRVCNNDDEEYVVKLHRDDDGIVVREFRLGEWYDVSDKCDNFEDVSGEFYYITIHEDDALEPSDTSEVFYFDGTADRYFRIESPGDIIKE